MELHDTHDTHAYILVSEMPSTTNDKNEPFYRSEHTKKTHLFWERAISIKRSVTCKDVKARNEMHEVQKVTTKNAGGKLEKAHGRTTKKKRATEARSSQ